ncbi:MAG: hypothetical protein K5798_10510 [Nitrosopumilus sp.]|uniref:hypothetical protein n=1 Tax=Nitrosopumilus sp. TaxID=2024843 RepID=UPI00242F6BB0|nr:hypothetical protein [Nitrosopumilus sp.]MCV0367677.1 hypothetical protein [Nitrosopumilus sp.]
MKYFMIFLVLMGFAISPYLVSDSFGLCVENQDWQDAPCYGCRGCYPGLEQEKIDWLPYYDFKGSTWMNAKKQQLETAMHNNSLREWFEQSDSGAHKNVHRYYFLQGDVPNTYGMNFDEALGFEKTWNAVEDNSPDAPLFLWTYHDVILDGTLIETDLAVTITGDHVPLYHIKANKYFKGEKNSDMITAVENPDDLEFDLFENGLFYLKKLENQHWYTATIASVPTFGNCDARSLIEISPNLPNEKPPVSMPARPIGIDPCVPDYFDVDPDDNPSQNDALVPEPKTSRHSSIENIDDQLFKVIGPFTLRPQSKDTISFEGVEFSHPYFPVPTPPGGVQSVDVSFEDGTTEHIGTVGPPNPFLKFTDNVDPKVGVRRNSDGTFDFLVSVENQSVSPLKQIRHGIPIDEIQCKDEFVQVFKKSNNSPACVSLDTKEKLMQRGWAEPLGDIIKQRTVPSKPELTPLDIASIEDRFVHLNPTDMCATISLRLLSHDDLKQTKSGTKDVVFFELDEKSLNEFPILGELIRATHYIESPSNEHFKTEIGLRELVDYEFFIMEKAIAKYNDTQDDYFMKLDGNLDEKLADPKKQGFSNEFVAPQIVYRDKSYTMGSTVFWIADEYEMQSISIRLQDDLKEDEKYITLTDKDMDSVPKIKQTIEKIGTELESIVAFKGVPENPDWNNYREWFDQKKTAYNLDDVYVKGFVHDEEYYDLGFPIC